MSAYRNIIRDGVWAHNPGLTQLLGICPLLAVSNTVVNGLGLGMATVMVLCASNLLVSLARPVVSPEVRLPVFVLIIASLVAATELLFQAYFYELYLDLGIFIPLIVTNCVILGRAEAFASRQPPGAAVLDGIANGLGFAMVLVVLGGMRELISRGSLLHGADQLFGARAAGLEISLFAPDRGFVLALMPTGAFLSLALLVALRNWLQERQHEPVAPEIESAFGQSTAS